ncbi:nucleotidyltransferase family protein [Curtobacterium flaccumfaciens]|uniref:hypothetical protein n=1 Tax=Curtobacterium flaccumfaciens TaxID=2035 RepID=UPI001E524303|nr:hypothetical protein [Curtobacterium flaccumfaciens]
MWTVTDERPWGTKSLRRVGEHIRTGASLSHNDPSYDQVMLWYNDLATWVQSEIEAMDWGPLLPGTRPSLVSRPKTIDTLRQKLDRQPTLDMGSVQDIAGVRFEAEMTLDQQDAIASAIAAHFDHDPDDGGCVRDLRTSSHSGYRAVHVWLRFEKRGRVEVQVRTHMQGAWANLFERAADVLGRNIRYGELPAEDPERLFVRNMISLSENGLVTLERLRNDVARDQLFVDDGRRGLLAPQDLGRPIMDIPRAWSTIRETERLVLDGLDTIKAGLAGYGDETEGK